MKKIIVIASLLFCILLLHAQDDLAIRVRRSAQLGLWPAAFYIPSGTSRTYHVSGLPKGCRISVDFNGGNVMFGDSVFTVEVFTVYRDSTKKNATAVAKGIVTTTEDFFTTGLLIKAIDKKTGEEKGRLAQTLYIVPQRRLRDTSFSSQTADPIMYRIMSDTTNAVGF
jgi:hypothetical protein